MSKRKTKAKAGHLRADCAELLEDPTRINYVKRHRRELVEHHNREEPVIITDANGMVDVPKLLQYPGATHVFIQTTMKTKRGKRLQRKARMR